MALNVKFLRGQSTNLLAEGKTYEDGHIYLTEDTHKLYAGIKTAGAEKASLIRLNQDILFVEKVEDLNLTTHKADQFYYAKTENVLCIYDPTQEKFVQVNPDDGAIAVGFEGAEDGNVLVGARYDAATRQIVFTKGKITAKDVKTTSKITVTTAVGNYDKGSEIDPSDIESILLNMLCQDSDPKATQPSTSITLRAGGASGSEKTSNHYIEVGSSFTPGFKVSNGVGKYTANGVDQASGVTVTKTTVTQSGRPDSNTDKYEDTTGKTSINSSFTAFTANDGLSYRMSVTTNFSAGVEPTTFLGKKNSATAAATIAKSDKSANTVYVYSYRPWFVGGTTATTVDGSVITGLTNKGRSYGEIEVKAATYPNCTKIVIAVPSSESKTLKSVYLKSSSNADILGEFKAQSGTVEVQGANGYETTKPYKLWIYEPASLDSTEVYTITVN